MKRLTLDDGEYVTLDRNPDTGRLEVTVCDGNDSTTATMNHAHTSHAYDMFDEILGEW